MVTLTSGHKEMVYGVGQGLEQKFEGGVVLVSEIREESVAEGKT